MAGIVQVDNEETAKPRNGNVTLAVCMTVGIFYTNLSRPYFQTSSSFECVYIRGKIFA